MREQWRALRDLMVAHLEQEEREFVDTVSKSFTAKQFDDEVVARIIEMGGLNGNRVAMPWILWTMQRGWADEPHQAAFQAKLPAPVLRQRRRVDARLCGVPPP